MAKFIDISGQRFGNLSAIKFAHRKQFPSGQFHNIWECLCDCGKTTFVSIGQLRGGATSSCGCAKRALIAKARTSHGYASHRKTNKFNKTYLAWRNMKSRCLNTKTDRYHSYGGRGIKVCERWMQFENFLADMGESKEGMSLERINIDGDYEPSNCKWIPVKRQFSNMQKSIKVTHQGTEYCLADLSRATGINYMTLYDRYKRGDRGEALVRKVKP